MRRQSAGTGRRGAMVASREAAATEVGPSSPENRFPPSQEAAGDDDDGDRPGSIRSPWWLPEQAAEYLHVNVATLGNWRYRGIGPRYSRCGRTAVYLQRWLDAWVQSQARGGEEG